MIICDKYIFIHVPKTGGKSVTKFLFKNEEILGQALPLRRVLEPEEGYPEHAPENYCSHVPVKWVSRYDIEHHFKTKFCVIRNPWDWYISYYFYSNVQDRQYWQQILDKDFVGGFNQWLIRLLSGEYCCVGPSSYHDFALLRRVEHMQKHNIGFFTQMFLDYCLVLDLDSVDAGALDPDLLDSRMGVNKVCKLESLKNDLLNIFKQDNITLQNGDIPHIQKTERPYPFNFLKSRYDFYEDKAKNLIYEKDKLIVEKYGYQF
jgi:hypothetical protein